MSYRFYRALTGVLWPVVVPVAAVGRLGRGSEWTERMGRISCLSARAVWLHAASVGEVAAATPLIRALASRGVGTFLTAVTKTGRAAAERSGAAASAYAPLDFVPAVRAAIASIAPSALLLTETELWPNLIWESIEAGIPVGVVNGRLSERSLSRYLRRGSPIGAVVSRLSFVAARTPADAGRFTDLGADPSRVHVVGDLKYDKLGRPLTDEERRELRGGLGVPHDATVVVFGSVRPKEEEAVARAATLVLREVSDAFVIVAPRHLARVAPLRQVLAANGVASRLRSEGLDSGQPETAALILDSTGELSRVYALGDVAFVGGTLAAYGGHDPLEPASQGVPVLFGRDVSSCEDAAQELVTAGGGFFVNAPENLGPDLLELLRDESARERAGRAALGAVIAGRGATDRTLSLLERMGIINAG